MSFDQSSTKDRIFIAGIHIFAKHGYSGARVRQICKLAKSSNMNAVNYYFGGKANLYKVILEMMFSEFGKMIQDNAINTPNLKGEEQLCCFIKVYCEMLFTENPIGEAIQAIFNNEMAQPSPYLNELIDRHLINQNNTILEVVGEILGPDAPRWLLQDCGVSIFSQIIYYSSTWRVYSRVNPTHPGMGTYKNHLADHVCRFSLAGLKEMKRAWEAGELTTPEF